ncbi:hypothetical protein AT6N2_C1671 [Agrobacterium tumefaciens]|nr:hypothetical protein AT6N2_C1671 [Agrobacterium tumefaciens]
MKPVMRFSRQIPPLERPLRFWKIQHGFHCPIAGFHKDGPAVALHLIGLRKPLYVHVKGELALVANKVLRLVIGKAGGAGDKDFGALRRIFRKLQLHSEHGLIRGNVEIDDLEIIGCRFGQSFTRRLQKPAFLTVIVAKLASIDRKLRLERDADILADADEGGEIYFCASGRIDDFQLKRQADGVVVTDIGEFTIFNQLGNRVGHAGQRCAACRIKRDLRGNAGFTRFAPIGDPAIFRFDLQHAAYDAVGVRGKACHAHLATFASGPVGYFGPGDLRAAEGGDQRGREAKMRKSGK